MSTLKERYTPVVVGVNATVKLAGGSQIGGFLAKTTGAITVVDGQGVTIVNAVAVTAGIYTPMPFLIQGGNQARVTTSGGASGTLGT